MSQKSILVKISLTSFVLGIERERQTIVIIYQIQLKIRSEIFRGTLKDFDM